MNNQSTQMQDKDLMFDVLATEKQIANNYSVFANECATPALRSDMLGLLQNAHEIQAGIWNEISTRGWYEPAPAEQPKIDQSRQKFEGMRA